MKLTDGLFAKVFEEIGKSEYPEIERARMIVDIAAAMLADKPERFDVMVMPNLYGDVLSDIAAQITGSVGLGSSANIGEHVAMFEAIAGSAPDIAGEQTPSRGVPCVPRRSIRAVSRCARLAGKDIANPSGLLLAAVQMLMHINHPATAEKISNAWLRTLEDGIHTADIYHPENKEAPSKRKVGTRDFAKAVIERLGQKPTQLKAAAFADSPTRSRAHEVRARDGAARRSPPSCAHTTLPSPARLPQLVEEGERWAAPPQTKLLTGVDIFLDWSSGKPDDLAGRINAAMAKVPSMKLKMITNRGVKVWPNGFPETFCTDHWRCRMRPADADTVSIKYDTVRGWSPRHTCSTCARCHRSPPSRYRRSSTSCVRCTMPAWTSSSRRTCATTAIRTAH